MRCCFALLVFSALSAYGQYVIPSSKIPKEWRDFETRKEERKLDCKVTAIAPRLNYSFRFQTGYILQVPLRQYEGKGHWIATLFRVTPVDAGGDPVYFLSNIRLPEAPPNKAVAEFGGGYVVGEGKYRVDMVLTDNSGRVCVSKWNIKAKLDRKVREVQPGMAPGTIDEISLRKWTRGSKGASDRQGHRLTVLMNAGPIMSRRVRLAGYDRILLLSSLASLVERLPLRSVRLVVFSLDQQREIYRDEDFEPADFGRVAQSLSELELGSVAYDVLKKPRGHLDFVADLLVESLRPEESDAVVFVGPKPRQVDKVQLPQRESQDPPVFYVQFRPFVVGATQPDTLMNAVGQLGGKTFQVYSPKDFAEAIRDLSRVLEANAGQ